MNVTFSADREDDPISGVAIVVRKMLRQADRRRYIPFPRIEEERERPGDPGLSIEESDTRIMRILCAANSCGEAWLRISTFLPEDAEHIIEAAKKRVQSSWRKMMAILRSAVEL